MSDIIGRKTEIALLKKVLASRLICYLIGQMEKRTFVCFRGNRVINLTLNSYCRL